MTGALAISVGCLLFCIFAFLYFRAYIERRTSFDGILKDVRDEVNRLLQRIDEITDKDISLIEDREKGLKALLDETDRRLAVLNRDLARRETAEEAYRKLGRIPKPEKAPHVSPESAAPLAADISRADPFTRRSSMEELPQEDQLRKLVRSGFSPQVIASRLGISISEAELAVALQERRDS
jgi:hypothetical protein